MKILIFSLANFKQTAEANDDHEQELELEVGGVARLPGHRHQRGPHRDQVAVARADQKRGELPGEKYNQGHYSNIRR